MRRNPCSKVVCDEAISSLDITAQREIIELLSSLQKQRQLSYLFISHDLGVVQHMSDHIAVMYMGKIVEYADRLSLFNSPRHPYTKALLSAVPSVDQKRKVERLLIPGDPPDPLNPPRGCRFASRCPFVEDACRSEQPPLTEVAAHHKVACIKA